MHCTFGFAKTARVALVCLMSSAVFVGCGEDSGVIERVEASDHVEELAQSITSLPVPANSHCDAIYEFRAHGSGGYGEPATMNRRTEGWKTYAYAVPWGDAEVQAISLSPIIDNTKMLNEWRVSTRDAAGTTLMYQWGPGDTPPALPDDVGYGLPRGRDGRIVLELHYRNNGEATELDRSGVRMCVVGGAKLRKQRAAATSQFVARDPLGIPADIEDFKVTGSCAVANVTPVKLLSVSPNMRARGRHATLKVVRADGTSDVLLDTSWSFASLRTRNLPNGGVTLQAGDKVETTCFFYNFGDAASFGDRVQEENCANYATYVPKGALDCQPIGDSKTKP